MAKPELAVDGETEEWVVTWFPPAGDRQKKFHSKDKALRKAASEREWNPILEHRVIFTASEIVPFP